MIGIDRNYTKDLKKGQMVSSLSFLGVNGIAGIKAEY